MEVLLLCQHVPLESYKWGQAERTKHPSCPCVVPLVNLPAPYNTYVDFEAHGRLVYRSQRLRTPPKLHITLFSYNLAYKLNSFGSLFV